VWFKNKTKPTQPTMNKNQNWPALNTPILAFTVHINQGTEACGRSQQKMEVGIMESLSHLTSEEGGYIYIVN
jgi:hypothetical protein